MGNAEAVIASSSSGLGSICLEDENIWTLHQIYLCSAHTHTQDTQDQLNSVVSMFVEWILRNTFVPGHKTKPVCECAEWERTVVLRGKDPFLFLPHKINKKHIQAVYLFGCGQKKGLYMPPQCTWRRKQCLIIYKKGKFQVPWVCMHVTATLNTHPSFIYPMY